MATRAQVNFVLAVVVEYLLRHHKNDPVVRDAVIRAIVKVGKEYGVSDISKEALKELYTKITGKPVSNDRRFLMYLRRAVGSDGIRKIPGISIDDVELALTEADVK